jgi:hypothetical protein
VLSFLVICYEIGEMEVLLFLSVFYRDFKSE